MILDLWLVLRRKLTKAKLDKLDALAIRLGQDLLRKDAIIESLRKEIAELKKHFPRNSA